MEVHQTRMHHTHSCHIPRSPPPPHWPAAQLRQQSGANVQVAKAEAGNQTGMRTITLAGSAEQIQQAQFLISMKVINAQQ